jgi:hypothetical protein
MFLNTRFKYSPQTLLDSYAGITMCQTQAGTRYKIDPNGIGYFDLVEEKAPKLASSVTGGDGVPSLMLEDGSGVFNAIEAYYLVADCGQAKTMALGNQADYFFTDNFSGCQFTAYGNDRHNVTVCHSNYLPLGAGDANLTYLREAAHVRNHPTATVKIIYGQTKYRLALGGFQPTEDRSAQVVTVIGWRKDDGWHFYAKRVLKDYRNWRQIDPKAIELL